MSEAAEETVLGKRVAEEAAASEAAPSPAKKQNVEKVLLLNMLKL